MRICRGSERFAEADRGCVLTIGNFDGIHLGHQALLAAVVERARDLGEPAAVYTFDPHPRRVLSGGREPALVMTWEQLERELGARGVDVLVRERFTADFATQSPEAFLTEVVHARIAPAELFIGRDFHFGKGRGGSGETLGQLGPELGIRVVIIPQVRAGGRDVSSTRIRESLQAGAVEDAAISLGRPYAVWGRVVHGDHRGRTLGFPTVNLELENELVPAFGVYATHVRLFEGDQLADRSFASVTNVGTRPTFEPGRVLCEAHLLDFEGDLYGRRLALSFVSRIRDERRFPDLDALARQIGEDAARARQLLQGDG